MKKLKLFLNLIPVDYLKEILIPKTNNLMKHLMDLGEFILWLGCWLYMGFWVVVTNRRNGCSAAEPKMSVGDPFMFNKYISRTRFELILGYIHYIVQKYVGCYDSFFHMSKI